jgi:hypothetical protein
MKLGDQSFDSGTFLIMRTRNEDDVLSKLQRIAKARDVSFVPVPSSYPELDRYGPGSGDVFSLRKPDIGVVFGDMERPTEFGAMWYLMDKQFHLPFTPLSTSALSGANLSKYTCIVFPEGSYSLTDQVRTWVRAGGCAVVLGQPGWALGDQGFVKATRIKSGDDDPGSLPGALFRAQMDPRLFLTYGYHAEGDSIPIAVPVAGSDFYNSVVAGGGVVTFSKDEKVKKLVSGWEWPNDTEAALKGALWAQDQPFGGGHAIIFTEDPSGRAMWPGLYKLLLNAMLMGAR